VPAYFLVTEITKDLAPSIKEAEQTIDKLYSQIPLRSSRFEEASSRQGLAFFLLPNFYTASTLSLLHPDKKS
jgi:hypothetical protein